MAALKWDLFCRVVDNLGDAGFCWRLAAELAARGHRVRLVIDDAAPLALIARQAAAGVDVLSWPGPATPGDVIIEAFGCDLPADFVAAMAAQARPPVWLNLEHLSAEDFFERSHGLPSPQPCGLVKWFFFPGFSARSGGLIREQGLMSRHQAFDRQAWLAAQGLSVAPQERIVSLFCYDNAALPDLLQGLAGEPTLLLLTQGHAQRQVEQARGHLRLHRLPWLAQSDFDRLLWACDLNFVRGEDSLVRAIWAGAPFVWQLYPQHDQAHAAKLQAMLDVMAAPPALVALWRAWNGFHPGPWPGLPAPAPWREQAQRWRGELLAQNDLVTRLLGFVAGRHSPDC